MGDKATAGDAPGRHGRRRSRRCARQLLEAVAENDEELLNKYLEDGELSPEEIRKGLADRHRRRATSSRCSRRRSTKTIGVSRFLDAVADYFPSPADVTVKAADGKELKADAGGPAGGAGVQDDGRPLRRQADLPARVLRHAEGRLARLERQPATPTSASASSSSCAARRRSRRTQLVAGDIGAVAKLGETLTGDTLTTQGEADQAAADRLPGAGLQRRRLPEVEGGHGEDEHAPWRASSKRTRSSTCTATRTRARRSSPASASRTSRSPARR